MSPIILRASLILAAIVTIASANPILAEDDPQQENRNSMVLGVENKASSQAITSKTSSLLAEALQMIRNAKDAKERRWLESFVHRLAKLASELEQEKQTEKLLKTVKASEENEVLVNGKSGARSSKFASYKDREEHVLSTPIPVEYPDTKDSAYSASSPEGKGGVFDIDLQVPEKSEVTPPQGNVMALQKQIPVRVIPSMTVIAETGSTTPSLQRPVQLRHNVEASAVREDLINQIISKVQKLRDLGVTNEEMMALLKRSEYTTGLPKATSEFEEEEEGAAAGELEPDDLTDISTLAPSLGQIGGNDMPASQPSLSQKSDEDDLVKQLEEEKFILVNTASTDSEEEALRRVESSANEEGSYH